MGSARHSSNCFIFINLHLDQKNNPPGIMLFSFSQMRKGRDNLPNIPLGYLGDIRTEIS